MKNRRFLDRTLGILALASLVGTTGCEWRSQLVTAYPAIAPILGGRATPAPFVLNTGNIKGIVIGSAGPSQPVPLAFVTTGSISAFAANPVSKDDPSVVQDADEKDDGRTEITVMHDVSPDGSGDFQPTIRRLRKKPSGDTTEKFKGKYVYLRAGEYFLEGVPEGIANVSASFGNVSSSPSAVTVYSNTTVTDVGVSLFLPTPVINEDGTTPHIVEWADSEPSGGITVSVEVKKTQTAVGTETDITTTYKPDPPDVTVTLRSPPGSGGVVVAGVTIVFSWSTLNNPVAQQLPPIPIPLVPQVVGAAQPTSFGPPSRITVKVGSSTIKTIFGAPDPRDQPGLVIATMEFTDDNGFAILGKNLKPLHVACVLTNL